MNDEPLTALLQTPSRQAEARACLRAMIDAAPVTLSYMRWRPRLPMAASPRRVVFASNFTLATLEPFMEVESYLAQWRLQAEFAPYTQWLNTLVAPTDVTSLDAIFIVLHLPTLLGGQPVEAGGASTLITDAIDHFRSLSNAPVLIGLLDAAPSSADMLANPAQYVALKTASEELRATCGELTRRHLGVYHIDVATWCAEIGAHWYDAQAMHSTMCAVSRSAASSFCRLLARAAAPLFRPRAKVLALDLDNTLWGGVVGEEGLDGIQIAPEGWPGAAYYTFQQHCKNLRDTGILLAMVSKNNEADARAVFDSHLDMPLEWHDFSAHQVNWNNKATNLEAIANQLGLGLDSVVFADDSP